jgi:hypothetical protein
MYEGMPQSVFPRCRLTGESQPVVRILDDLGELPAGSARRIASPIE